jgi:N-acetylglucosamine-6-phosphate deacetylase
LDVIDAAVSRSVVAAVGHTDATYAQTRAAFDRGASVATHLFNAMRPLGHREPGPVQAALDSAGVWCELIVDGVHLHPAIVAAVFRACPERVVLVTDAMAATGAGDGHYRLGELDVTVEGGCARLADGTIAGSTLTMDVAVARTIAAGVDSALAQAAATSHPATVIGR